MMLRRIFLALALLTGCLPAHGQSFLPSGTGPYQGPIDVVGVSAQAAYSCTRLLRAAYTGNGCNIRRTSDSETCDVGFTNVGEIGLTVNCSGADNGQAASTFCNATTCFVTIAYDQSGSGTTGQVDQPTAAEQPQLVFSAQNGKPAVACIRASPTLLASHNGFTLAQPFTFSVVAARTGSLPNNNFGTLIANNGGTRWFGYSNPASVPKLEMEAPGTFNIGFSDTAFHVVQAFFNGGSSILAIDSAQTVGNPGSSGFSSNVLDLCEDGTVADASDAQVGEWIMWVLSSGQLATYQTNAKAYWGTP